MWKKMLFTFTGLACVLTLPALATEPQGLTIAPGGCVLDWVRSVVCALGDEPC